MQVKYLLLSEEVRALIWWTYYMVLKSALASVGNFNALEINCRGFLMIALAWVETGGIGGGWCCFIAPQSSGKLGWLFWSQLTCVITLGGLKKREGCWKLKPSEEEWVCGLFGRPQAKNLNQLVKPQTTIKTSMFTLTASHPFAVCIVPGVLRHLLVSPED